MTLLKTWLDRDKYCWRKHWRLIIALLSMSVLEFLLDNNLAIHSALEKLKLPNNVIDALEGIAGVEAANYDFEFSFVFYFAVVLWLIGFTRLLRLAVYVQLISISLTVIFSIVTLLITVAFRDEDVWGLLWDAVLVWIGNMVVFAIWYWMFDSPHTQAESAEQHKRYEFLFPHRSADIPGWSDWKPRFFDYLFLAFTTGTAFSPTDTAPLSRRAKFFTMLQASSSLIVIAVLAARGINILKPPT
jgi:hypothetical protein